MAVTSAATSYVGGVLAGLEMGRERPELDDLERPASGPGAQAAAAFPVRPRLGGAAEEGDAPMAQRRQMLDGLAHAAGAVHQHGRHAPNPAIEQDEGRVTAELLDLRLRQA